MIEQLLQSINSQLVTPFWQEYGFWLGIVNLIVLIFTLLYLKKYTNETEQTRKQIAKQTELEQMPIMLMFIRNIIEGVPFGERPRLKDKFGKYLIKIKGEDENSDYIIKLRNTGKGTAFNVRVESDKFDITDYETQFFAPLKDEHTFTIVQKGNNKIESWEIFKNSIFTIKCSDVLGNDYLFRYKIINFKKKEIEYMGKEKSNIYEVDK